ncbi:hypothetical protein ES332_A07G139700v1 [Gossypium tomentosum]|uniref:Uncharacterized protein n=1 Tax=Gossypium tomentosum TaxID=34277 RepID=A0A5D2PSL5_GOSTO|nr:hypothetical protein ES332_A07G139700v1 [Gossypium tomentosum]
MIAHHGDVLFSYSKPLPKGYGGAREWCFQRRGVAKGMGVTRVFPFLLFFYYWFGLELVV